ncbi:MAG: hypothetical protein M1822_008787 [Bathelium mastoideum]|nr:MAG: hypothetical protein M1822_008787 [Bathelium mastoideum]
MALPGYPSVILDDLGSTKEFLEQELWSQQLETIAPRLWVMSTFSHTNINTLHRQHIKGWNILVTEDPKLHLVWIHDRILIKLLPQYLLSYTFWEFLLGENTRSNVRWKQLQQAALGFLHTYVYLVCHESDFVIAQQDHLRLIPQDIKWVDFCSFAADIKHISDDVVS